MIATDELEGTATLCGAPPDDHDPSTKSVNGKCPHCGSSALGSNYGLAASGIGFYSFCNDCDKYCDFLADDEGEDESEAPPG